jgi:hypothetical protein
MSDDVGRNQGSRSTLALVGAGAILGAGLIHLVLVPEHFAEARYLGVLFAVDFLGSAVAAFGIYRGYRWGWILGALIAVGALAAYVVSVTVGLPGVEKGDLFEPVGVLAKALEALFLAICVCKFAGFERWILASGLPIVILVSALATGMAMALDQPGEHADHGQQEKTARKTPGLPVHWVATSPAIHLGDQYDIVVTNTSDKDQKAQVRTQIMDHRAHKNTNVINQSLNLAPGEERELTAVNDYGAANHFQTGIASQTKDLGLSIKVTDSEGNETARFNQDAFLIQGGQKAGS